MKIYHRHMTEKVLLEVEAESLQGANLQGANLQGANLYGANLQGAYLYGAYLHGANLHGANLQGAYLYGANLYGANLRGANLQGAYLYGANLEVANLQGAKWAENVILEKTPIFIGNLQWTVWLLGDHMQIGCQLHTLVDWATFSDEEIVEMDGKIALRFWRTNKEWLLAAAEAQK